MESFSQNKIENYKYHREKFLEFIGKKSVREEDVEKYLTYLAADKKLKNDIFNQILESLKFFKENFKVDRDKIVLVKLTNEKLNELLDGIVDLRDKILISFMYYSKLKPGEILKLKKDEVKIDGNEVFVKDFKFVIDNVLKINLGNYLEGLNSSLFFGDICLYDVQEKLEEAARKVSIKKPIFCHSLR